MTWLKHALPIIAAALLLSMVAAACGGTTEQTTTKPTGATTTKPTATTTKPTTSADKPKYGGTLNLRAMTDPNSFDEAYAAPWWTWSCHLTEDEMLNGDWTQGWAGGFGTKAWTWTLDGIYNWSSKAGSLCESWDFVAPNHMVLKVRKGVNFALDSSNEASRLVNGREVTAEDIAYSYLRLCSTPQSYIYYAHPFFTKNIKVTATDRYTLDIVVPDDPDSIYQFAQIVVDWNGVFAKEVIDKWGDMKDWRHAHGTGPFFLKDFVSGSTLTFVKNPNYWDVNPIGPGKGDQLPYVDGVKIYIITDSSTYLSAIRTGKLDASAGMALGIDDTKTLTSTRKDIQVYEIPGSSAPGHIHMRTDKIDSPYSKKLVRQALTKAVDYKTIVADMYEGKAVYPTAPISPLPDLKDNYLALEDCSDTIKDLYVYDTEKAKQMLAEAGYPNGFSATVYTQNNEANVDYLSIIKDMWLKINVQIEIIPIEIGVYNNRWYARDYEDMFFAGFASPGTFRTMVSTQGSGGGYNLSYIVDSRLENGKTDMLVAFNAGDDKKCAEIHKSLMAIIYEECWIISTPAQTGAQLWQPWLKNYHGETAVGILNNYGWAKFVWIDKDLKEKSGY
jgi:peptide/nickel transport system substrate-binding protein